MDQQAFMDMLVTHGHFILEETVKNDPPPDEVDVPDVKVTVESITREFVKMNYEELLKPCERKDLKPDDLPPLPLELYYSETTDIERRSEFFRHLYRRDILYVQVINGDTEEGYKCGVLAKHNDLRLVDDLSLVVYIPPLESEWKNLSEPIQKFDLMRGALWSCAPWERKLYITFDDSIFDEKEEIPKLGKITRKDLPYYMDSRKNGMSYAGYVQRSEGFLETGYLVDQLEKCCGVDTKQSFSFLNELKGKTIKPFLAEIRKLLNPDISTKKLHQAFEFFRTGDLSKALHYANRSLRFNPDNILARVTRGTVYANLGQLTEAFVDTEDSLKLNKKHKGARKQMSELLVSASQMQLRQKQYFLWHETLVLAKKYNRQNQEALELLAKAKYETSSELSTNGQPVEYLIPPSMEEVAPIYNRVCPKLDNRRLVNEVEKQQKRKRKRAQRRKKQRLKKRASAMNRPIPTTVTVRRPFSRPTH